MSSLTRVPEPFRPDSTGTFAARLHALETEVNELSGLVRTLQADRKTLREELDTVKTELGLCAPPPRSELSRISPRQSDFRTFVATADQALLSRKVGGIDTSDSYGRTILKSDGGRYLSYMAWGDETRNEVVERGMRAWISKSNDKAFTHAREKLSELMGLLATPTALLSQRTNSDANQAIRSKNEAEKQLEETWNQAIEKGASERETIEAVTEAIAKLCQEFQEVKRSKGFSLPLDL
ncbi:uncharacterized protein MKK02DRAFT_29245 [Dioszegia hungarica]|uniref:Uncharacterized protein n=1 Tax=Dioszegia hungarica TaxID=4972 RepID=A0AA38LXX5_9TREE|nr:uncharacterized protein MKK02DRAFT_29245 [Dioszegia hungarica]KAI9639118.1 hypothetical protein MKK02DRAFT_29245 [Dioszegia hungarica]